MIHVNRGFNDAYVRNALKFAMTSGHAYPINGNNAMFTVMSVSLFDSTIPTVAQWDAMGFAEKNQVMITHDHPVHIPVYNIISPDIRYSYNPMNYPAYTEVLDANSNAIGFDINMRVLDRTQCLSTSTLSWFMLAVYPRNAIPTSDADYTLKWRAVWGTIGTIGSGADMELPSLSVTQGQEIVFRDIRIELARQFIG